MIIRPQFGTIEGIRTLLRTGPPKMRAAWTQPGDTPMTFRPLNDPERLAEAVRQAIEAARNRAAHAGQGTPETGRYVHHASGIRSDDINEYLNRVDAWSVAHRPCHRVLNGECMFDPSTCANGCHLDW